MKKILFVLTLFIVSVSYAQYVECVGNAVLLENDGNTLFVFEKNPELKTKTSVGNVAWYSYPDTTQLIQASSDYLDSYNGLEHGKGYMIKKDNMREVFWVFDYDSLRVQANAVTAELTCENTVLTIDGNIPPLQYHNQNGRLTTYPRMCRITYQDAMWGGESWVDSVAVSEQELASTMTVSASPVTTDYAIADALAMQLGLQDDTLYSPVYEPIALKAYPQTITTTRGKQGEKSNEVNRPYTPDDVVNMSAPLEVLFKSNGLNADFYQWKLYKGSELIITRNDAEHRYTFMDKGNYRAVVVVSNHDCQLDSISFDISVSESMLLVPNVFTPNGDGANDEFRVVYRSIKEFQCWVYNRWGHQVFHSDNPDEGWDGTIGGRPAAEGAYFYVIRALGTDADENAKYTLKPVYKKQKEKQDESLLGVYQLSGSINLLRGGKK